jgi:DNA-binding NtrC family response regulator
MSLRRLLVVDDETSLLQLIEKYLIRLGYAVDSSSSGSEAWARFQRDPEAYLAVISDLTLPDMSGEELLHRILGLNPAARVLVCSGYPFDTARLPLAYPAQAGFLQKPFLPKALGEALDRLLKEAQPV